METICMEWMRFGVFLTKTIIFVTQKRTNQLSYHLEYAPRKIGLWQLVKRPEGSFLKGDWPNPSFVCVELTFLITIKLSDLLFRWISLLKTASWKKDQNDTRTTFEDIDDPKLSTQCPYFDDNGLIRIRSKISERSDCIDFRFSIKGRRTVIQSLPKVLFVKYFQNQGKQIHRITLYSRAVYAIYIFTGDQKILST